MVQGSGHPSKIFDDCQDLKRLLMRCCKHEPKERPTVQAALETLEGVLGSNLLKAHLLAREATVKTLAEINQVESKPEL